VRTIETDSGRVVQHYFITGQLSTVEWTDKDGRFGRSRAYKRDGTVIVDHHTRRIAGHASVHFEYHPSGAVSKAEFSDAPDAGIQWYRSTTTFDDQGNRTGFSEQGHDDLHHIPSPGTTFTPPTEPFGPVEEPVRVEEVAICQKLFVNEVFLVNPTKWTCTVDISVDNPSPALQGGRTTIGPRDTLRIGSYSVGERSEEPEGHVRVFASRKKGKGSWHMMARYRLAEEQVSPEHRRYYRVINGWTSTKRIW
jgi:hypothetical protein